MMTSKQYQTLRLLPYLIFVFGLYFFCQDYYGLFGFPLDDAWIHRVYAQSFAMGQGFAYNTGIQETGATSPLWVILTSPTEWLEYEDTAYVVGAVKIIGCILTLLVLHCVYKISALLTENKFTPIVAASLLALDPRLIFSALSGMESTFLLAIFLCAIVLLLKRNYFFTLVFLGFAPITRPEAIVVIPVFILAMVIQDRSWRLLRSASTWIIPVLPFLSWLAFCQEVSGDWLPNTFYVKAVPFHLGMAQLQTAFGALIQSGLTSTLLLWPSLLIALALFFKAPEKFHPAALLLVFLVVPLVFALAVVGSREVILDGYNWTRWLDPYTLMITVVLCLGLSAMLSGMTTFLHNTLLQLPLLVDNLIVRLLPFVGVFLILLSVPRYLYVFIDSVDHISSDARVVSLTNVEAGKWIAENTPEDAVVAVHDAGAIRYFGQRKTIDLLGLNNHEIMLHPVLSKRFIDSVDWFVVFPAWLEKQKNKSGFSVEQEFSVEPDEYTLCNCTGKNRQLILKRL